MSPGEPLRRYGIDLAEQFHGERPHGEDAELLAWISQEWDLGADKDVRDQVEAAALSRYGELRKATP